MQLEPGPKVARGEAKAKVAEARTRRELASMVNDDVGDRMQLSETPDYDNAFKEVKDGVDRV